MFTPPFCPYIIHPLLLFFKGTESWSAHLCPTIDQACTCLVASCSKACNPEFRVKGQGKYGSNKGSF